MKTCITLTLQLTDNERQRYEGAARALGITLTAYVNRALEAFVAPQHELLTDARATRAADGSRLGFR